MKIGKTSVKCPKCGKTNPLNEWVKTETDTVLNADNFIEYEAIVKFSCPTRKCGYEESLY